MKLAWECLRIMIPFRLACLLQWIRVFEPFYTGTQHVCIGMKDFIKYEDPLTLHGLFESSWLRLQVQACQFSSLKAPAKRFSSLLQDFLR